jgi:hypothetical protein
MLDQVRKGTRHPGPKLLRRIEEAEIAAGVPSSRAGHVTGSVNIVDSSKYPAQVIFIRDPEKHLGSRPRVGRVREDAEKYGSPELQRMEEIRDIQRQMKVLAERLEKLIGQTLKKEESKP